MGMRDRREKRKRAVVSAESRLKEHTSGGDRGAIRFPSTVTTFDVKKEGAYSLDILPYTVKYGKATKGGNPYKGKGEMAFERTYWSHKGIGPQGAKRSVLCTARTFGEKCAVCDHIAILNRDPEPDKDTEKAIKDLLPKERQLWALRDNDNPKKGVQVWEYSFHLFGKNLDKKIDLARPEKKKQYLRFADPDEGSKIVATCSQEGSGRATWFDFTDIEFEKRDKAIPDSLLDQVPDLDKLVINSVPETDFKKYYKWVKELLSAPPDEETEDGYDDSDTKKKRKKDRDTDEDEDDDLENDEEDDDGGDDEEDDDGDDTEGDEDEDTDGEGEDEDDEDEDSDGEGEDEDGEEDESEDEDHVSVGMKVSFLTGKKGDRKRMVGKVTKINKANGVALVQVKGEPKPRGVDIETLTPAGDEEKPTGKKKKPKDDEDEDDDLPFGRDDENDEDEDDKPRKKVKKRGK